jgi:hypothetical protein
MWLIGFAQRSDSWRQMKKLGALVRPIHLDRARSTKDDCMVGRPPQGYLTSAGASIPYGSSNGWSGGCVLQVVGSFREPSEVSCPNRK